jgi:hypothetical protein
MWEKCSASLRTLADRIADRKGFQRATARPYSASSASLPSGALLATSSSDHVGSLSMSQRSQVLIKFSNAGDSSFALLFLLLLHSSLHFLAQERFLDRPFVVSRGLHFVFCMTILRQTCILRVPTGTNHCHQYNSERWEILVTACCDRVVKAWHAAACKIDSGSCPWFLSFLASGERWIQKVAWSILVC